MSGSPKPAKDGIPKPPSPEDLEEVSQDQALITDEWADAEPPAPKGAPA